METITRSGWAAWSITVLNRDGEWRWCELDPAEALAKARMQQFTPPIIDHFNDKDALRRLLDGEPLTVWCLDGTQITIEPTHLRKERP